MTVAARIERWPLAAPFRISGYTFEAVDVLLVEITCEGHTGRGEAAGVYYRGDQPETMIRQVELVRAALEAGVDRERLQQLLPPGGARNAIDCALWDLEAKCSSRAVWSS